MEYYSISVIVFSIGLLLRTIVIENGKNDRFKKFPKKFPKEDFNKLSEYEEKSKFNFFSKKE